MRFVFVGREDEVVDLEEEEKVHVREEFELWKLAGTSDQQNGGAVCGPLSRL